MITKGVSRHEPTKIPVINVYFDRSYSFQDPFKTQAGEKAIATLNKYQQLGKLKIHLYYVSDKVYLSRSEADNRLGASGYEIIEHVKQTRPDNVIVLTDSDASVHSDAPSVVVPGGV